MSRLVVSARVYPFLQLKEGLRLVADNKDGTWTCGYGHTQDVTKGTQCSIVQAGLWLHKDVELRERCVSALMLGFKAPTQGEFDALVSWCFNLGAGRLARSKGLKLLQQGDPQGCWRDLSTYVHDKDGNVVPGLVTRREEEGRWFFETV